jgi:hypothetical protein
MAENLDDETLDNPINIQSENLQDEIISPSEIDTITPNQETDNMEVHHHSHAHGKKTWKGYFWEFLMLFVAVFCGFLAEFQLEHTIEKTREKQFINSLINDIKADTARLRSIIISRDSREAQLDSLFFLINSDAVAKHTKDIYFIAVTIPRNIIIQFTPNNGTLQQLKNAGGLRLIRKHWVADSIVKYDVAERSMEKLAEQEKDIVNIFRETAPKIINAYYLNKMVDADNNPIPIAYDPPLEAGYKQFLNEFNYRIVSIKNINKGYRRETKKLLLQASNLLRILKKEYNLD